MPDREKLIEELDSGILMARVTETKLVHIYVEQAEEIIAMLKEQQQQIWELQDQVEYLTDKQEGKKFLVDSDGKITPLPEIVRCKDCKRKDTLSCPKAPVRPDDWYCADGERR